MTKVDQNLIRQSTGQGQQLCQKWKKSKKLFKSYRVNKNLRPAAEPAAEPAAAAAAPAAAYEPVQKHKVTPSILGWLNNTKEINDTVKASCVKIMPLTRSVECEWKNKSHLPTNVFDTVNAPPPYTLDIDDSGGNNSCNLSDVAECSIILDKN